jgi:hypothetical protein
MGRGTRVWAALSDSEKADIALETAHLPRAYELLQALDQDLADTAAMKVRHGNALDGEASDTRYNPATEDCEAVCLCGEVFSAWRSGPALDRLLIHISREQGETGTETNPSGGAS